MHHAERPQEPSVVQETFGRWRVRDDRPHVGTVLDVVPPAGRVLCTAVARRTDTGRVLLADDALHQLRMALVGDPLYRPYKANPAIKKPVAAAAPVAPPATPPKEPVAPEAAEPAAE